MLILSHSSPAHSCIVPDPEYARVQMDTRVLGYYTEDGRLIKVHKSKALSFLNALPTGNESLRHHFSTRDLNSYLGSYGWTASAKATHRTRMPKDPNNPGGKNSLEYWWDLDRAKVERYWRQGEQ